MEQGWERRKRAHRERTEKSKRLKALTGLYNIHYQRVSLCEISLGSAFTRWTQPSLPPWFLSLQPTPSPSSSRRHLLPDPRSHSSAESSIPRLWGVQNSHVTTPSSGARGRKVAEKGEERRVHLSLMKMSHTPGTPARLLGLEPADPGQGTC